MSFLAVDVHYADAGRYAVAAGVLFAAIDAYDSDAEHVAAIKNPAAYQSGAFYLRELPCILHLLTHFRAYPESIIVDGYVDLGAGPGMGRHLYTALDQAVPIIGVAKRPHPAAAGARQVRRGTSTKPLYVTAAGIDPAAAATLITRMHGPYRIPTLLKRVDQLARNPDVLRW